MDGSEWKSQNGSRKCQWLGPLGLMGPEWDREKDDAKQSWRDIIRADGHHLFICLSCSISLRLPGLDFEIEIKSKNCLFRVEIKGHHLADMGITGQTK